MDAASDWLAMRPAAGRPRRPASNECLMWPEVAEQRGRVAIASSTRCDNSIWNDKIKSLAEVNRPKIAFFARDLLAICGALRIKLFVEPDETQVVFVSRPGHAAPPAVISRPRALSCPDRLLMTYSSIAEAGCGAAARTRHRAMKKPSVAAPSWRWGHSVR